MKGSTLVLCALVASAAATPAFAGPPFLSDDPDPTPYRQYEIYAFANGAETHGIVDGAFGIDFNYGATPDLQLTATLPVLYEHGGGGAVETGLGNVELAAKFRFLHQEQFGVDVAFFPRVFLPSASHLGDDHAALLLPIWLGRSGDRWSTFGGGGCAINRGGDSRDYCIAGAAVTWAAADNLMIGTELFHQTADVRGGSNSTVLGLGLTYDFNEHLHWLGYAGAGLENAAENGRANAYTSLLLTF